MASFSRKDQIVNILGFAGHMVSVATYSTAVRAQKQP